MKRTYTIITNKKSIRDVRAFAQEHCAERTNVGVQGLGNVIEVTFKTKKDVEGITYKLVNRFSKEHILRVCKSQAFVWKRGS